MPVVAEILGVPSASIPWKYKNRDVRPLFLRHLLAVNDVRVAFEVTARSNPNHELLLWLGEQEAKDTYTWGYEQKTLAPDAYGRYRFGDRVASFFVEVDQATMSLKRWRDKVDRYLEYADSGRYEERFGMKHFRVVVVTTTQKRLANLKATVEGSTSAFFWFVPLSDLQATGVLAEVWQRSGSRERQGLLAERVASASIP